MTPLKIKFFKTIFKKENDDRNRIQKSYKMKYWYEALYLHGNII